MSWDPFASGQAVEEPPPGTPDLAMPAAVPAFDPFASGQAAEVDPLDDFELYNAIEDHKESQGSDPADPGIAMKVWRAVKGLGASAGHAVKALGRLNGVQFGVTSPYEAAGLLSQTAGEVLANYKTLGEGAKTIATKAKAGAQAVLDPSTEAAMKRVSREASWNFQREARDVDKYTGEFNQFMEDAFPRALAGLGSAPVDRDQARGLSMVADPANLVPAGQATRLVTRWSVPLRGAVRAAQSAVKEASLDVAQSLARREAANLQLKPGLNAAQRAPLFEKAALAGKALEAARSRQQQAVKALARTADEQRAIVDSLANEASSQPLVTRVLAAGAQGAGRAAELAGTGLRKIAEMPDKLAGLVAAGADEAATKSIGEGLRNVSGAFGLLPATAGTTGMVATRTGQALQTFGRVLAEAEGQLPFFKRLARETKGLTSWGAGLVDQSGLGDFITPVARATADASRGAPLAGLIGYTGSGGDKDAALSSATGGMVFGLAGAGYGQWRRYLNGATYRQRQLGDVTRYRQTLPTDEARAHFDKMPAADRAALATMQLAHPDLKIKHERLGAGRPSFYYAAEDGPVAVINMDAKDGVNAVVAHEIGHHVEAHGLGPVIERTLFGDPLVKQPGLYTQLDSAGQPLTGADGRYQLNADWQTLKDAYNDRIKATAARTGEVLPARSDSAIAKEFFAEHVADYLTGGNGALGRDLKANIWTRALDGLADSSLVAGTPAMRQILGKLGLPLDTQKRVAGSNLFPGGLPASKEMRGLISSYHRQSVRNRAPALVDEPGGTRYTAAEVAKHPQIVDTLFDGSDDVVRNKLGKALREKDGTPKFASPKEQAAQRSELAKDITGWMEQNAPREGKAPDEVRPPGARIEKTVDEKGKETEGWITPSIPHPLLRQLEASGKFNPTQLRHLASVSDAISGGKGQSALFYYQPAMGKAGKYKSLAGDWRTETPYAIFISKAGNVLFRTVSREKLVANAGNLIKSGRAAPWNNEIGPLMTDVDTYLANHAAGKPGSEGIGIEKRDLINALFGIDTKMNRSANPLLESSPKSPVVIRSRRIDRTNRLTPVEEYFPTNYEKLNRNLRPEAINEAVP